MLSIILLFVVLFLTSCGAAASSDHFAEIPQSVAQSDTIKTLMSTAQQQQEMINKLTERDRKIRENEELKALQKKEQKSKQMELLKRYRETKGALLDELKQKLDKTQYEPVVNILTKSEKGAIGIYIIHNKTKDKWYIGQAKQLNKRVQDHFKADPIAIDYLSNKNEFEIALIPATELNGNYTINAIEMSMIELIKKDHPIYNKTEGNLN